MKVPLQKIYFDTKEEKALINTLRSGWVTQGPKVAEFEKLVGDFVGAKYAIATSSATTALSLSLYALGIGPGDEVIVPSLSFIATANSILHVGAKPVFVDIDPKTYNIDPKKIEVLITNKTEAIIPVDQVGLPTDLEQVLKVARKHKLYVVEDAACALGSSYKGRKVGSFGDLACFSFHPRKIITTGEGGMILTNNKTWADSLKILRHHGMSISDLKRNKTTKTIFEKYPVIGYNFRMSDLLATVGVEQMKKLPLFIHKRAQLAKRYHDFFSNSKNISTPFVPENCTHNFQSYVIRLRKNKKITRDQLMQKLLDYGISTRIGIMAAHLEKPYRIMYPKLSLLETEKANKETIAIPIYFSMTKREQDYVISKILELTRN
ncbi:MAG: DegT/DnrJ/EryC1/StrS family aminotransferase [bacterium]